MEFKEYLQLSKTTLSTNFYDEKETKEVLTKTVSDIVKIGDQLDQVKKVLFYGKKIDLKKKRNLIQKIWDKLTGKKEATFNTPELNKQIILHGAIGMVTESVELLKEVFAAIQENREFDSVNIFEELGDSEWYEAVIYRGFQFELAKIWETNISKLEARYGKSFSEERALNRDLKKETDVLSQGLNS